MQKVFENIRRAICTALAHKHDIMVAVLTFAADHKLIVIAGFTAVLGAWFIGCAFVESWRSSARNLRNRVTSAFACLALSLCNAEFQS